MLLFDFLGLGFDFLPLLLDGELGLAYLLIADEAAPTGLLKWQIKSLGSVQNGDFFTQFIMHTIEIVSILLSIPAAVSRRTFLGI